MKRYLVLFSALAIVLVAVPICSAQNFRGGGGRHGGGHSGGHGGGPSFGVRGQRTGFGQGFGGGFGHGFGGLGFGIGVWDDGNDLTNLYRELLKNVPYFALHPPVYYSYPVPRTYGYSPFAYPPYVMTPEIAAEVEPLTIDNPYVPRKTDATPPAAEPKADQAASAARQVEPLVIINPFVTQKDAVARSDR
jgi:hypothetical protein